MQPPRTSTSRLRRALAPAAALLWVLGASGCSAAPAPEESTPSAHYASIDDLAADSSAIVIGDVTAQRETEQGIVSTLDVVNTPGNPQLGTDGEGTVTVGDDIDVRQSDDTSARLEVGNRYVLFLTPSADAASGFAVVGGDGGVYVVEGEEARRVAPDAGDALPDSIAVRQD